LRKNSKEIALSLAGLLEGKKAIDTVILDITKISFIADYFIISTAQSPSHLKTLSNALARKVKENHIKRNLNYEGSPQTGWVLLDCGDVVIHLFSAERRDYYHLEYIWQEAEEVSFQK